jgi:hypothetical protein
MAKRDPPHGLDIEERAEELLKGVTDLTLLILKAHLLLEEELYNQLRQLFPQPKHYDALNMRFIQNVQLARAFCVRMTDEGEPVSWVEQSFDALEALNTFRNRLAHNLEPGDLSHLLERMKIATTEELSMDDPNLIKKLAQTLGYLLQFVGSLNASSTFDIALKPLVKHGPGAWKT